MLLCALPALAWAHGISDENRQHLLGGSYLQCADLGASHRLTGHDRLLFLFGVVLFLTPFKDVAKFVTMITIDHCITLILVTC